MIKKRFHIYGDNIVECVRAFDYIRLSLEEFELEVTPLETSIVCPSFKITAESFEFFFQFLPGYGTQRWNQDILEAIKLSGGKLREAADAILTILDDNDNENPLFAFEFCGALPAGNQAWQRHGRAFSYAHAKIPYFFITELGGYELGSERERRAERVPNPAVPFSFIATTYQQGSVCLPVYEANAGTSLETFNYYKPAFGKEIFLDYIKAALLDEDNSAAVDNLSSKSLALISLLVESKKVNDGLTVIQWEKAYKEMLNGKEFLDFLKRENLIPWKKSVSIDKTETASKFLDLASAESFGIAAKKLPISFVPQSRRREFSKKLANIYQNLDEDFLRWVSDEEKDLAISWLAGYKPRGDDSRPDRGLPPLTRMLIGEKSDLLSFVYGPVSSSHWKLLENDLERLSEINGLWESILAVSNAVLIDSTTKPCSAKHEYLKKEWDRESFNQELKLKVEPKIRKYGEQDVDTVIHVVFESLGEDIIFEGICNPPGGDWSGLSFRWSKDDVEHRWLTLPRVSLKNEKRPDHVFALFGFNEKPICLCVESKEAARSLESNIGPRLKGYVEKLFNVSPSVSRANRRSSWETFATPWERKDLEFISVGAYLSNNGQAQYDVRPDTNLDLHLGIEITECGTKCTIYVRAETEIGKEIAEYLNQSNMNKHIRFVISS
ncbi:hypothetical protein [Deinococcus sp. SL84]|uniref:hypothetical protein n=1 Tax=Deinococcus sp. SL84 TaxID=2994663 RepID=UPI00227583E3|nr:hypothetical protein [Deinococcus sp. SL84]MCY1703925.1 hypothetical protein [Deinococcus sp. SL84]